METCANCRYYGTFDCEKYDCGTAGLSVYGDDTPCRYYDDTDGDPFECLDDTED